MRNFHTKKWMWIAIFCSCGSETGKKEMKNQDDLFETRLAREIIPVKTVPAQKRPFEYLINTSGKIQTVSEATIHAQVRGIIAKLRINNGKYVREGTILARLQSQKQRLAYEKAKVQLREKELAYESLLLSYNTNNESFEEIKSNVKYNSGLASAQIALKEAEIELGNTIIKSPISGIVADLNVKEKNMMDIGDMVCVIRDCRQLYLHVKVLETDIRKLRLGQEASVFPIAMARQNYKAVVSEINPKVDEHGMLEIKLKLSHNKELLPGMTAKAIIKVPYKENIIVPKEAVLIRSGKTVVFTEEQGLAKWHYVTVGMENSREIEILEGLTENAKVIITNNLQLAHDTPVKIANE